MLDRFRLRNGTQDLLLESDGLRAMRGLADTLLQVKEAISTGRPYILEFITFADAGLLCSYRFPWSYLLSTRKCLRLSLASRLSRLSPTYLPSSSSFHEAFWPRQFRHLHRNGAEDQLGVVKYLPNVVSSRWESPGEWADEGNFTGVRNRNMVVAQRGLREGQEKESIVTRNEVSSRDPWIEDRQFWFARCRGAYASRFWHWNMEEGM
jgi:hypothetical protein